MRYTISYLYDQQGSTAIEVQTIGIESSYQPIYITDDNGTPLRLSYRQAQEVIVALRDACGEIESENKVPKPNREYPGYVVDVDIGKGPNRKKRQDRVIPFRRGNK